MFLASENTLLWTDLQYINYIENPYTILTCRLIIITTLTLVAALGQEVQEEGILLD